MIVTLYPKRKRCKRCRRYFGPLVVDRLYDSYECAGIKPPDNDPARWPRQHSFRQDSKIREKAAYDWPEAPRVLELLGDKRLSVYFCTYCWRYHVGHDRAL